MTFKATAANVRRRIEEAEKAIGGRWLEHFTTVLGDELRRHPEADQRAVLLRIRDIRKDLADTSAPTAAALPALMLRAVRLASPAIADAVEHRLGKTVSAASQRAA